MKYCYIVRTVECETERFFGPFSTEEAARAWAEGYFGDTHFDILTMDTQPS